MISKTKDDTDHIKKRAFLKILIGILSISLGLSISFINFQELAIALIPASILISLPFLYDGITSLKALNK